MKVLIAPNSMKGSLNAFDFADTVEKALIDCSSDFETRKVPVADGGDFTGEVLKQSLGAKTIEVEVVNPFGKSIPAKYAISENKAIIEMADASGMKLVDASQLNPLKASSYGCGQLIADAISKGCTEVYLAIGGSATVDGGIGMMQALGFQFLDINSKVLNGVGASLSRVKQILPSKTIGDISFKIICDVDNPLLGENGAAAVFGPQKGATHEMVNELEVGLANWAQLLLKETGKDLAKVGGAGAAGGISVPLMAYFNAEIVPGADFVLQQLNFEAHVKWADIIITGEGKIDSQTLNNKAPFAVAKVAKKQSKPVFAIGGKVENESTGIFNGVFSLVNGPMSLDYAMANAEKLLYNFTFGFAKTIKTIVKL